MTPVSLLDNDVSSLFTRPVAVAIARQGLVVPVLLPEEQQAVASAHAKRRAEFALGRTCARIALAKLSGPQPALPVGPGRAPIWPNGFVGSLSHCDLLCVAVAARAADTANLGVDVEPATELRANAWSRVVSEIELEKLNALGGRSLGLWTKIAFCAKEAFYKAYFPLYRRRLDFLDVELALGPHGSFDVRPVRNSLAASDTRFEGRWVAGDGLIVSGVTVSA